MKRTKRSDQELQRAAVLLQVKERDWSLQQAAERMGVSYRQAKRLWKRYGRKGAEGLVHGNVGRASNRAKPRRLRQRVLKLMGSKYGGEPGKRFGPTLVAEHLGEEDGIKLGVETVRGWMLEAGLWSRERKGRAQGALRGVGADGWELPRVAGRARAAGLFDEHGR